jgi:hypothetical protein
MVRVTRNIGEEDYEDIQIREVRMCMGPFFLRSSVPCRLTFSIQRKRPCGENTHSQLYLTVHESFLYCRFPNWLKQHQKGRKSQPYKTTDPNKTNAEYCRVAAPNSDLQR